MSETLLQKLNSRKLWVVLGAVLMIVSAALAKLIPANDALSHSVDVIMTYLGAQGLADVAAKLGPFLQKLGAPPPASSDLK